MGRTQDIGNKSEKLAVEYLGGIGFEIAALNWRSRHHEIDIIAKHEGILHIIEVKCRKAEGLTIPEDAMTRRKFAFLCSAARDYIALHNLDMDVQFDLIAVDYREEGGHELRYFPSIMTPRW